MSTCLLILVMGTLVMVRLVFALPPIPNLDILFPRHPLMEVAPLHILDDHHGYGRLVYTYSCHGLRPVPTSITACLPVPTSITPVGLTNPPIPCRPIPTSTTACRPDLSPRGLSASLFAR